MRTFVSYSWDSPEHKVRVKKLCDRLKKDGVNIVADCYLQRGKDLNRFMTQELPKADKYVIICTETYTNKVNAGKGGAAFEDSIITSARLADLDDALVIPVIMDNPNEKVPDSISTLYRVDLNNNSEEEYRALLASILNEVDGALTEITEESSEEIDFEMPNLEKEHEEILLRLLKSESKQEFFPQTMGSGARERQKKLGYVTDLADEYLLRFFNYDQNGVELTALGEAVAMRLDGKDKNFLPETEEIMREIIMEANERGNVLIMLTLGCGKARVNKLRIARNLEDNGYLRTLDDNGQNFQLTSKGRELAKEIIKEKSKELDPNFQKIELLGEIKDFDYSNNNGRFTLGVGEMKFTVDFSKASDTGIYVVSDEPDIENVSISETSISWERSDDATDIFTGNTTSDTRRATREKMVVWENVNGYFMLMQITDIKDDTRDDDKDSVAFKYKIGKKKGEKFKTIIDRSRKWPDTIVPRIGRKFVWKRFDNPLDEGFEYAKSSDYPGHGFRTELPDYGLTDVIIYKDTILTEGPEN